MTVVELMEKMRGSDATVRMEAAHRAGPVGAAAVGPLAELLAGDRGVAKAADEALRRIVHHSARPGARSEARAVAEALLAQMRGDRPEKTRTAAIRLLEFVGSDESTAALGRLLGDPKWREDARLTVERIPGRAASRALETALKGAPAEYRPAIEASIRHRKATAKSIGTKG